MRTVHFNLARGLALLLTIASPGAGQSDPAEPPPGDAVSVAESFEPDSQEAGGSGGAVPGILAGPITNAANGHVYYLLASANWTDSQMQAQALGGHLVTINDAAEDAWVYATFSSFGGISRALWTGLNDAAQEGTFVWASGESATYRNWSPGEPNNFNAGQDYVDIFPPGDVRASQWDDENNVANLSDVPATPVHGVVELSSPPTCLPPPSGMISWWRGEGNALDGQGPNHGTLFGGVGFASGIVDQSFTFDGQNDYIRIASSPSLEQGGPFTVEGWINYETFTGGTGGTIAMKGPDAEVEADWTLGVSAIRKLRPHANVGGWILFDCATTLASNTWYHVAMVYDGTTLRGYVNGVLDGSRNVSGSLRTSTNAMKIGTYSSVNSPATTSFFDGRIDELSIYNRALAPGELLAIYSAGTAGKCAGPQPAFITSQPQNRVAPLGTAASFTVGAGGTAPLFYQWYFGNAPIAGATTPTLEVPNVQFANAGDYHVVVSNLLGSVTSSNATLTVIDLGPNLFDDFDPGIDAPQWSAFGGTVLATNHGGFISGPNSLWFGGTGSRFAATRSLDTSGGGDISFYLRFGNASNPWERVDLPGEGVALEYSLNSGQTWAIINTYNTSNFVSGWVLVDLPVPAAARSGDTRFRWRQLANSGATFDHWALDDVSILLAPTTPTPPSITGQPADQVAPIGGTATFSVAAQGSRPLTYRWLYNGTEIAGGTNATLSLNNVQPHQVGLYSVEVANALGSVVSDGALLLVNPVFGPDLTIPAFDTGWYDASGFHNPGNGNYIAGDSTSTTTVHPLRNFFVFNMPEFADPIASAVLRVRTFNIVSPTGSEDFELNEVTTPVATLRLGGSGLVSIWQDLGDGPVYGHRTFTTAERSNLVNIALAPEAIPSILAARGTSFALGGKITSLDAIPRNGEFVFGSSSGTSSNNAFLVLSFVPPASAPALSAFPDQAIDEDSVLGPLTFAVYDAQTAASNLVLTAASSNPALVPDGAIIIGGAEIVRSLTITPAANQHGTTVISIIATDGDGNSTTNQFMLTVLPINDPPVADAGATVLTHISPNNVDAQVILDGSLSSDVDGDALTYAWRDGSTDALLGSGVVAIITRPVGANPIALVVSDGLTNDSTTITVVVKSAAQAVGDLISFLNGVTVPRNKQALLSSLEAAMASFAEGNFTAAVNQLEAFQQKVRAQVGPDDPVLADTLISLAQQIIDAIVPPAAPPAGLLRTEMSVTAVKHLPNGRVKLHFPGWAGRVYLIQASSDLVTWETIGTGRHLNQGAFEFEDAQATQRGHRYYRVVMP